MTVRVRPPCYGKRPIADLASSPFIGLNKSEELYAGKEAIMINGKRIYAYMKILLVCLFLPGICAAGFGFQNPVVPVVDGRLGGCSAEFTVTDKNRVPMYDAKIDVELRHGFLRLRKMSLQVGTNSDGRARVAGLPDDLDKTYRFKITSGELAETVVMNTSDGCSAVFEITLDD